MIFLLSRERNDVAVRCKILLSLPAIEVLQGKRLNTASMTGRQLNPSGQLIDQILDENCGLKEVKGSLSQKQKAE